MKSYRDLDLELSGWSRDDAGLETLRVRVVASPAGEQRRAEEEAVSFDTSLRDACSALGRRELDLPGMFALGRRLGDLLLPPAARGFYDRSRARLRDGEGLRLRIRFDTWAVADIPWEFAWLPPAGRGGDEADAAGFLALNPRMSVVRYEPLSEPLETLAPVKEQKLRLVAVLSSPNADPEWPPLALEAEARGLEKALAERPEIELVERRDATLQDLEEAIGGGAHIFHFAGHGRFAATMGERIGETVGRGFLVLRDPAGRAAEVAADAVVVNLQGRGVRLAVLGACEGAKRDAVNPWTGIAPALVRGGLPAVVAMQATLRDESAVAFSARFYRSLAEGEAIDAAVAAGRLAIFNQGGASERDWGTPVLYLRAESGVLFPVASAEEEAAKPLGRIGWANVGLSTAVAALAVAAFYLFARPRFPDRWLVGSGVSLATIGGAALAWLMWLAGDDVRSTVRRWLRRRAALASLATAMLALGGATYVLANQRHTVVRILPGTNLGDCLPSSGEPPDTVTYSLRIWQGADAGGRPTWIADPLPPPGLAVGASQTIALNALDRNKAEVDEQMTEYLKTTGMPPDFFADWRDNFWHLSAANFADSGGSRRNIGEPLVIELLRNGKPIASRVYKAEEPIQNDAVSIEVFVVSLQESHNEC